MKHPATTHSQIAELCQRIKALPMSYASLSDMGLVQMSAFFVTLKEGLCNFTDLYEVIRRELDGMEQEPFVAIYAEFVHRITGATSEKRCNPSLIHALYQQAICAPQYSYGEYGEEDWVYDIVFNAIENIKLSEYKQYDYAAFDLLIDTCHIFGTFEPEDKAIIDTAMAKWNEELDKDGWVSLPVNEVAQRLRLMTAYYDLSHTDLMNPVAQSVRLLEAFSDRIVKEGDADTLIIYREALRNVYCYQTVRTEYFTRLEQVAKTLPAGFSSDILQGMLRIDRLERELADLH